MLPLFAAFNVQPRDRENSPRLRVASHSFVIWRVRPRSRSQNSGFTHCHRQLRPRPNFPRRPLLSLPPSPVLPRGIDRTNECLFPSVAFPFFLRNWCSLVVHPAHRRRRHHPSALLRHFVFGGRKEEGSGLTSDPTLTRVVLATLEFEVRAGGRARVEMAQKGHS